MVLPFTAWANVNTVTPSPAEIAVPPTGTTVTVTWRVRRTEATAPTEKIVSSTSALLQVGGVTVATLAGLLSDTSTLAPATSETLVFTESLPITAAAARRIARAAPGSVRIVRTFTDTQSTGLGRIDVFAGGGNTSGITVHRIDLSFENDARTDIFHEGDTVRAVAQVSFRGTGTLKGEWRIVDPTASLGSGGRRVLQVVRQPLVSSGQGRTKIVSPFLPTREGGLYLVSFSVQDTTAEFEIPILRYFVLGGDGAAPPVNLRTLTPEGGARLTEGTVFSWTPVPEAVAYQLEILEQGAAGPVAGKLVSARDLKLALSSLTLDRLVAGTAYDWRVRAFGPGGKVIGQSERAGIIVGP